MFSYVFGLMVNNVILIVLIMLQINVKINIVSGSPCGAVAAEAKKIQASWVVLDKYVVNRKFYIFFLGVHFFYFK